MEVQSLSDLAREHIMKQIAQGVLIPGQQIKEEEIAGRLNISRPPIREAFKSLEAEGLVVRRPRRGVFVTEMTLKDVWEVYTLKAYLYAMTAVLLWATVATAFKVSLRNLEPLQLLLYASVVSTLALFVILLFQGKIGLLRQYSGKEYLFSAILGLLNPFFYYVILFEAYSLLPAQQAQPINMTWPIVLVLLSIPILKQRIRLLSILAIVVSFFGVYVLATKGDIFGFRFESPLGVALALGSTIFWSLFWILNVRDRRDEVAKLFLSFLFGTAFALPVLLAFSSFDVADKRGLLGAAYVGIFEMGVTFVVWLMALKTSRTTAQVSNLIYVSPFLSLIPIHFVAGEKIFFSSVVGLAFIVGGVLLQGWAGRRGAPGKT